ncbi:hypothetical protein V5O48_006401 [Marasmius crinis-equi]|uniref:Uncharacterized protein n=1 Tax=Marasmius crinis-equi TaxID=585013 RepID=A0ABR3FK95_9AGAR
MEASNAELAQQMETDPKSVDIENITEGMEQYIEMNLGLGVFTTKPNSSPDKDTEMSPSTSESSDSNSMSTEDSSDQEYDSDSSDESGIISSFLPPHLVATKSRMIKPLPRRSLSDRFQQQQRDRVRPHIAMLSSGSRSDVNLDANTVDMTVEHPTSVSL